MDLTNEDVADILALLDSLPYDELDLETSRFRLTLRRTPAGWTQSTQILAAPAPAPTGPLPTPAGSMPHRAGDSRLDVTSGRPRLGVEGVDGTVGTAEAMLDGSGEAAGGEAAGGGEAADRGGEAADRGGELVAVRAPLPGTFYRAPRPGAAPFTEVGSRVGAETVIGIVETMKLMNPVHAGVAGVVAEFCVANADFAAHGATLLRIRADP